MRIFVLIAALLAVACDHPQQALHVVYAIDLSASIEPRAMSAAFEAASGSLRSLERGDRAAVIPILGDNLNETQGRILRYALGRDRKPYDSDLRMLAAEEQRTLQALRDVTLRKPEPRTDILGAVDLAAEELGVPSHGEIQVLLLLSDFVHDDTRYCFLTERRLVDPKIAQAFATDLAKETPARLERVRVFLGALTSKDLARLTPHRRTAIRTFWTTYLRELGAEIHWATDGSGRITAFLATARTTQPEPDVPDGPMARVAALTEPLRLAW